MTLDRVLTQVLPNQYAYGCCNLYKAGIVVALTNMILCPAVMIVLGVMITEDIADDSPAYMNLVCYILLVPTTIMFLMSFILYYGIRRQDPWLTIPYLIYNPIGVALTIVPLILAEPQVPLLVVIFISIFNICIAIYHWLIIFSLTGRISCGVEDELEEEIEEEEEEEVEEEEEEEKKEEEEEEEEEESVTQTK